MVGSYLPINGSLILHLLLFCKELFLVLVLLIVPYNAIHPFLLYLELLPSSRILGLSLIRKDSLPCPLILFDPVTMLFLDYFEIERIIIIGILALFSIWWYFLHYLAVIFQLIFAVLIGFPVSTLMITLYFYQSSGEEKGIIVWGARKGFKWAISLNISIVSSYQQLFSLLINEVLSLIAIKS